MLHEDYRPRSFDDFVGNSDAISKLLRVISRPRFDRGAFWIDGPSGVGKTTLAFLLARKLGTDDFFIDELDGDRCNVEAVRNLERTLRVRPMVGEWKAVIVNEAHAMTQRAVQAWLTLLERLPRNVVVVFTTTEGRTADLFGQFDDPLLSRCFHVALSSYGLADAFAKRAKEIAESEGLDGQPLAKYKRLVADCKNNFRMVLQRIEMGNMIG